MELQQNSRLGPKRLVIDIDEELHQLIKVMAAKRNISMRTYIIRAISAHIKKEKQYE